MTQHPHQKMWFRAKRYGWGWYPVSWEGWAAVFFYAFALLTLAFMFLDDPNQEGSLSRGTGFFIFAMAATIVLFRVAYKHGERPKWRWGGKP